jgi:hypothetical protein
MQATLQTGQTQYATVLNDANNANQTYNFSSNGSNFLFFLVFFQTDFTYSSSTWLLEFFIKPYKSCFFNSFNRFAVQKSLEICL